MDAVKEFVSEKEIPERDANKVNNIIEQFKKWVVPTAQKETLADILCAAWKCYLDEGLWNHVSQIEKEDWRRILQDLTFKSFEVLEVTERLQKAASLRETQ